jgi:hypothetical protein
MEKNLLTEMDRSKQLFQYTTKVKKTIIPEKKEPKKDKVEEGHIVTLTEFLRG